MRAHVVPVHAPGLFAERPIASAGPGPAGHGHVHAHG